MRYLTALRRNAFRHSFDLLDVSFSESTPAFIEMDAKKAAAVKEAIADSDKKCAGIKAAIVFVPESDLKGMSAAEYIAASAAKPAPKAVRRGGAAKPAPVETAPPAAPRGRGRASKDD